MSLSGPAAIENAMRAMIERAPKGATGVYIAWNGITYGYRTNRDKAPADYIFFDEPPAPFIYRYNEPIRATRALADDGDSVIVEMNPKQAHAFWRMSRRIAGSPQGARGAFDQLRIALEGVNAGKTQRDASLSISSSPYITSDDDNSGTPIPAGSYRLGA